MNHMGMGDFDAEDKYYRKVKWERFKRRYMKIFLGIFFALCLVFGLVFGLYFSVLVAIKNTIVVIGKTTYTIPRDGRTYKIIMKGE